jgi:hypothetical protein
MFEKPSGQAFVGSMSIKGVGEGMNGPDFCLLQRMRPEALWFSGEAAATGAFVFGQDNAVGMHPKRTRAATFIPNSINVKDRVI